MKTHMCLCVCVCAKCTQKGLVCVCFCVCVCVCVRACVLGGGAYNRKKNIQKNRERLIWTNIRKQSGSSLSRTLQQVCERASMMKKRIDPLLLCSLIAFLAALSPSGA